MTASSSRPTRVRWRWLIWLCLATVSLLGVTRFHVDNTLDAWVPDRAAGTDLGAYLVVGFDSRNTPVRLVRQVLSDLPEVRVCLDSQSPMIKALTGSTSGTFLSSADGNYAGMFCIARTKTDPARLTQAVKAALASNWSDAAGRFALAGPAAFASALNDYSQRRMALIITLIVLVGGVLMGVLTQSASRAFQSIAAMVMALMILLGAIGFSGVRVDMSMLLVPPMMISMGFSYAAHNALRKDASSVLVLCLLTTILGILFFSASGVPSIRAFAFWGAIGITLIWLCVVSLVLAPETDPPALTVHTSWNRNYRRLIDCLAGRWRTGIVIGATVLALLGPLEAGHLAINPQPLDYFPHRAKIVQDNAIIEANLTGMLPFEVITDDAASFQALAGKSPLVRTIIDITAMHATDIHQGQHVFWCMCNNDALDALPALFARWHQHARAAGFTFETRGIAAQLLEVRQQMKRVAAVSIPSMLLITTIISSVLAGSVRAGLAGLVVNLLPLSLMMLLAELWRLPLQLPTLMIGAIGIGAGVDDTIHILWLNRHRARSTMLSTCLIPCGGSSAITSICMAFFLLSPFGPTAQFGLLMAVILLLASLSDLVLLPILIAKLTQTKSSGNTPKNGRMLLGHQ